MESTIMRHEERITIETAYSLRIKSQHSHRYKPMIIY